MSNTTAQHPNQETPQGTGHRLPMQGILRVPEVEGQHVGTALSFTHSQAAA